MPMTIEAVYEKGVFRPKNPVDMKDGQEVELTVATPTITGEQTEEQVRAWRRVFEGLTDSDIDDITSFRESRKTFFGARDEG